MKEHYCKTYNDECICEDCDVNLLMKDKIPFCITCRKDKGMMLD